MATKKGRKPAPKTAKPSPFPSSIGTALALGAAAHLGSGIMKSIFDTAPSTISLTIESAEVRETINLSTRGFKLTVKPAKETQSNGNEK